MNKTAIKSKNSNEVELADTKFGQLLASDEAKHFLTFPKVGDVVTGTVIEANKSEVHVDIPGIGAGLVRGRELYLEAGDHDSLAVGDTVEGTVVELENENGEIERSICLPVSFVPISLLNKFAFEPVI